MSNLKSFLDILRKVEYPNSEISEIAKAMDFDLRHFLADITEQFGEEKTKLFTKKALETFLGPDKIVKIDVSDLFFGPSYVKFKIDPQEYDSKKDPNYVKVNWNIVDSEITDEDGSMTNLFDMYENVGLGEMGDWYELEETIYNELNDTVFNNLGFKFDF